MFLNSLNLTTENVVHIIIFNILIMLLLDLVMFGMYLPAFGKKHILLEKNN